MFLRTEPTLFNLIASRNYKKVKKKLPTVTSIIIIDLIDIKF